MKERLVNGCGAIPTYDQSSGVAEPSDGSLDYPTMAVPAQRATVLRRWPHPIPLVRCTDCSIASSTGCKSPFLEGIAARFGRSVDLLASVCRLPPYFSVDTRLIWMTHEHSIPFLSRTVSGSAAAALRSFAACS